MNNNDNDSHEQNGGSPDETQRDKKNDGQRSSTGNTELSADKLDSILNTLGSVDRKIHNKNTVKDYNELRNQIDVYLEQSKKLCRDLNLTVDKEDDDKNDKICDKISKIYQKIKQGDRKDHYKQLLDCYSELTYDFSTAYYEVKNKLEWDTASDNMGSILLCKNVRIMEDIINKICTNNIDKSIIQGDKHFDSIKFGFEWLFCHNDNNRNKDYKRIDIRDRNRFLDYIKYQMMVTSQFNDSFEYLPIKSNDIDKHFELIQKAFDNDVFDKTVSKKIKGNITEVRIGRKRRIDEFKKVVTKLIDDFFNVYELLISHRDALFKEEEMRKELRTELLAEMIDENGNPLTDEKGNPLTEIPQPTLVHNYIINLSSVALRVLTDRFVSFVKINDLNFGNSEFNRSWFNYSELSESNYAGSNFKNARMENCKIKHCDISTCNLSLADASNTDFSSSNLNYSNLAGMSLTDATISNCEFQNALFRDPVIDRYTEAVTSAWNKSAAKEKEDSLICNLLYIWHDGANETNHLKETIKSFKDIRTEKPLFEKTGIQNQDPIPVKVLDYHLDPDTNSKLYNNIEQVLQHYLRKHIPAALLKKVQEVFTDETDDDRSTRIDNHGKVELSVADLKYITAKHTLMSNLDFCHIKMGSATFEDSDLSGSALFYTDASLSSFMYSNLNQIEAFESDFEGANFSNALANKAKFVNCNLSNTNWTKGILIESYFIDFSKYLIPVINPLPQPNITLQVNEYVDFDSENSPKRRIILDAPKYYVAPDSDVVQKEKTSNDWQENCGLDNTRFIDALADKSVFINISSNRSTFNNTSFKNALFTNCRMISSDFIGADFRYAIISFCCWGQSNFSNANMTNTKMSYIDFSNCNMSNAVINLSDASHLLLENSNMRGMNFSGAHISDSVLSNSNIESTVFTGAVFKNCIFNHIHFDNVISIHSATFENCYAYNCDYMGQDRPDGLIDPTSFFVRNTADKNAGSYVLPSIYYPF